MSIHHLSHEQYARLCETYKSGANSGKAWHKPEEQELLRVFDSTYDCKLGIVLATHAARHRRSVHSIALRLQLHGRVKFNHDGSVSRINPTEETNQENTMYAPTNINFEKKELVLIRGKDAANMSDDEIFHLISGLKDQIKHLQNIDVKSTKIAKRIGELNDDVGNLVMYVDNR